MRARNFLFLLFVLFALNLAMIPPQTPWMSWLIPNYDSLLIAFFLCWGSARISVALALMVTLVSLYTIASHGLYYFFHREIFLGIDLLLVKDAINFIAMSFSSFEQILLYTSLVLAIFGIFYFWKKTLGKLNTFPTQHQKILAMASLLALPILHEVHHHITINKSFVFRAVKSSYLSFQHQNSLDTILRAQSQSNDQVEKY